jgi:hypothetical protein
MPLLLLSAKASHARYLVTCSMTTTDGQHNRTGGPGGGGPKLTAPAYGFLSSV